ncbi:MAG: beta-N-acetylhexosaminidase [Alphaproteobacteria bacterium]|nr:beta-N-acetylhexosaminidase [Alphaproteobacteria bacterium]
MKKRPAKAVIFGCSGPELLPEERSFFERCQPLGFILFARNCKTPEQVKTLAADLKNTLIHKDVPILIDQEGGRVARLLPPLWREVPPAHIFGQLANEDIDLASEGVHDNAALIGYELNEIGINVNCAPCADLLIPGSDPIIGDRAFSEHSQIVAELSLAMIEGLQSQNIIPIIKHLPGHGRAPVDSHKELPIVSSSREELIDHDFESFRLICEGIKARSLPEPWGMTAHVVYDAFDDKETATHSPLIIDRIIREHIGFKGFLISDCLTMEALEGSFSNRAQKALKAGCDAVLHCNGHLDEMIEIAGATPDLSEISLERLRKSRVSHPRTLSKEDKDHLQLKLDDTLQKQELINYKGPILPPKKSVA